MLTACWRIQGRTDARSKSRRKLAFSLPCEKEEVEGNLLTMPSEISRARATWTEVQMRMRNSDYSLNGVFFKDLKLADPDVYMDAVDSDLGETMVNRRQAESSVKRLAA